jgi:hypothetical protein
MSDRKQTANDLKNLPLSSKILGGILAVPVTGILLIAVGLLVKAVRWAWS